jgi:cyanophycinase
MILGLLGSGEFEPWAEEADRWLLQQAKTGDGRVLVLPTASAPEGDDIFNGWVEMARAHYDGLGIKAEIIPLKTRDDANDPAIVARLDQASMAFFSGGNPAYLAATLAGTEFWKTLVGAMARGLAYGGCSAGIACLGPMAPDSSLGVLTAAIWKPGLALFPDVYLGPHWDAIESFLPGATEFFVASVPKGERLLAVDERTAVLGDGTGWHVVGSGSAHLLAEGEWQTYPHGESFTANLLRSP